LPAAGQLRGYLGPLTEDPSQRTSLVFRTTVFLSRSIRSGCLHNFPVYDQPKLCGFGFVGKLGGVCVNPHQSRRDVDPGHTTNVLDNRAALRQNGGKSRGSAILVVRVFFWRAENKNSSTGRGVVICFKSSAVLSAVCRFSTKWPFMARMAEDKDK
jgi:hypothetical protein